MSHWHLTVASGVRVR